MQTNFQDNSRMYEREPYFGDGPTDLTRLQRTNIPNIGDSSIQQSMRINKMDPGQYTPSGVFARAMQAEREAISKEYSQKEDITQWIGYVPNGQMAYVNKLLRIIMRQSKDFAGSISRPDFEYLSKMWMLPNKRNAMLDFFSKHIDDSLKGFSAPISTRSAFGPDVNRQTNKMEYQLSNPGSIPAGLSRNLEKLRESSTKEARQELVNEIIDSLMVVAQEYIPHELVEGYFKETDPSVGDFIDKNVLQNIRSLQMELTAEAVDLNSVYRLAKRLTEDRHSRENLYFMSLIDPKRRIAHKIPSIVPVPTASFSIRTNYQLITNALGNAAVVFTPNYLAFGAAFGSFTVNNNAALVGNAPSNFFTGVPIGQNIPLNLYTSFRLVSAAFEFTPIVSQLQSSGFYTIGYNNDGTINTPVADGAVQLQAANYGIFANIENSNGRISRALSDNRKTTVLYLPPDESFYDFTPLATLRSGHNFVMYVSGAPGALTVGRLDLILNYEAMVIPSAVDYIPTAYYQGKQDDLQFALQQARPVIEANVDIDFPSVPKQVIPQEAENWFLPEVPKETARKYIQEKKIGGISNRQEKRGFVDSITGMLKSVLEPINEIAPYIGSIARTVAPLIA